MIGGHYEENLAIIFRLSNVNVADAKTFSIVFCHLSIVYSYFNASTGLLLAAFHRTEATVANMINIKIITGNA